MRGQVRTRVRAGILLGVWDATGADPLTVVGTEKGWALQGGQGVPHHERGHPVERLRRDLGLYLRQAAPDARLARAASLVVRSDRGIGR